MERHQEARKDTVDVPDNVKDSKKPPPRFHDIFAAPIKLVSGWVAPNIRKSDQERKSIFKSLKKNFVFASLDEKELETFVRAMDRSKVSKGSEIIKEGDIGDFFYIIHEGKVKFSVSGNDVGTASTGDSFGELALLYDCPRAATCTALEDCTLWRVDQTTFRRIMAGSQMDTADEIKKILMKVPFLAQLSDKILQKFIDALQVVKFGKGELIIRKGDEGKVFYIIKSGKAKVHDISVGGSTFDDQILEQGDFFGERAIVTSEPRVANITAVEDCTTYCLSRQAFIEYLGDFGELVKKSSNLRSLLTCPLFGKNQVENFEADALAELIIEAKVKEGSVLFKDDEGAFCLVQSGEVEVTIDGKSTIKKSGEYFGIETLDPINEKVISAKVTKDSVLGILTKEDILSVVKSIERLFTIDSLAKRASATFNLKIKLTDLKKHRLLGCGTFGKVWLVSDETSVQDIPYALKIQKKREIINFKQVEGVIREKNVMTSLNHPFLINLVNAYQDDENLYMLLPLIQGGELYSMLNQSPNNVLPEKDAKFYAAAIMEGLAHMHKRNILYRDLKPENVLIDKDGYPVIVDMGFAKVVMDKTYTLCGTPLYIAPEVIMNRGHNMGADQWSWAVLVYEMIQGDCPFYSEGMDQMDLFKAIVRVQYNFPNNGLMGRDCKDMISKIFKPRPSARLGLKNRGDEDIKDHPWLAGYDFESLVKKSIEAPWKPELKNAFDVSAFEEWDQEDEKAGRTRPLTAKEQEMFSEF